MGSEAKLIELINVRGFDCYPPELAPRDGTPFLGVLSVYPFPTMVVFNSAVGKWCFADLACEIKGDFMFDNEFTEIEALEGYIPIPEIELSGVH